MKKLIFLFPLILMGCLSSPQEKIEQQKAEDVKIQPVVPQKQYEKFTMTLGEKINCGVNYVYAYSGYEWAAGGTRNLKMTSIMFDRPYTIYFSQGDTIYNLGTVVGYTGSTVEIQREKK